MQSAAGAVAACTLVHTHLRAQHADVADLGNTLLCTVDRKEHVALTGAHTTGRKPQPQAACRTRQTLLNATAAARRTRQQHVWALQVSVAHGRPAGVQVVEPGWSGAAGTETDMQNFSISHAVRGVVTQRPAYSQPDASRSVPRSLQLNTHPSTPLRPNLCPNLEGHTAFLAVLYFHQPKQH